MDNFILIFLMMGAGILLRRLAVFPEGTAQAFNLYVIWLALPATILVQIPKLQFDAQLLVLIVLPWVMLSVSALAVWWAARRWDWSRGTTGALLMTVPLGNTSFLGIPMVQALYGAQAVPYAILYDALGSFLALATYGAFVVAAYGGAGRPTPRLVLKKVLTFPPFVALVLSLAVVHWPLSSSLEWVLGQVAQTLVPVVMLAVGLQLNPRLPRQHFAPVGFGLAFKLLVAPLLAWAGLALLGLEGEVVRVAIFEAGMAPMISAGALAIGAGLAPEIVAALVGFGIPLACLTLPALYLLLQHFA